MHAWLFLSRAAKKRARSLAQEVCCYWRITHINEAHRRVLFRFWKRDSQHLHMHAISVHHVVTHRQFSLVWLEGESHPSSFYKRGRREQPYVTRIQYIDVLILPRVTSTLKCKQAVSTTNDLWYECAKIFPPLFQSQNKKMNKKMARSSALGKHRL